jgi:GNAT superfamily N-acetyltransferase
MPLSIRRVQGRDIGPLREMSVDFNESLEIDYPKIDDEEIDKHMLQILSNTENPDCVYLIAYDGKKPVGFILGYVGNKPYSRPSRVSVAEELYVVPNKRGGKVGLRLMQESAKIALERGAEAFECIGTHDGSIKRWEKFGFKPHTVYAHLDTNDFMKLVNKFVGKGEQNEAA